MTVGNKLNKLKHSNNNSNLYIYKHFTRKRIDLVGFFMVIFSLDESAFIDHNNSYYNKSLC